MPDLQKLTAAKCLLDKRILLRFQQQRFLKMSFSPLVMKIWNGKHLNCSSK